MPGDKVGWQPADSCSLLRKLAEISFASQGTSKPFAQYLLPQCRWLISMAIAHVSKAADSILKMQEGVMQMVGR